MDNDLEVSRRNFIAAAVGAGLALSVLPGSLAAVDVPNLTKADLDKWMTQVSNAGRWGKDDQMGTVNLITAAKRKKAAALVREGVAISLAHDVIMEKTPDNGSPFIHTMNATGEKPDAFTTTDTYTTNYHGFSMTHMDALCHMFYDGHMYNDFPQTLVTSEGAAKLDITAFKNGIFTRGVLMDIPRLKNVPYLEPGDAIYPEDLDALPFPFTGPRHLAGHPHAAPEDVGERLEVCDCSQGQDRVSGPSAVAGLGVGFFLLVIFFVVLRRHRCCLPFA